MLLQIRQCPLDSAAGEIHISRNRLDTGPAASRAIGPVLEVHINGYSPGRQERVGVNAVKVAHRSTSCRGRLYDDVVTANGNGLRRLINAVQLRVNTGEANGGEVEAAAVEMPEDSFPKPLIGGKQKQRSRIALGHTVATVFPMRPSFSVGSTEEEAKGLPVQLISQPSLQRAEHPPAEALPRQSVQFHHAGLDALLQTDAFIQVTGVSAVISRAVFAAHIVGTVAKAAADASASARLMTGWRHHLHLCGEQGCELHKVSRQANPLLF